MTYLVTLTPYKKAETKKDTIIRKQKKQIKELELEKENAELKKEIEKHKWNDIFLEDCAGYDKKIAEEYTTLQERIEKLEKENAKLKSEIENDRDLSTVAYMQGAENQKKKDEKQLTKAKEIMNIAIEGIKHWGIVGGTERPFEKQAELEFNLFLEKAEQFLKEIEK